MFESDGVRLYLGDSLEVLPTLEAESVQCVVTSPPYWGLRDYGTATWEGGDSACDHIAPKKGGMGEASALQLSVKRIGFESGGQYRDICPKCGATRIDNQIGLEKTPAEYVEKMVKVFREVWRVLRDDGTVWLNLGDSYARAGGWSNNNGLDGVATRQESNRPMSNIASGGGISQKLAQGLKAKDLVGIPWRVAFALQADGWYLRQDIIWAKPNPMPESVTDRCTKSHEYIFLLTKSARYYYDQEAIKEPAKYSTDERKDRVCEDHKSFPDAQKNGIRQRKPAGWDTRQGAHGAFHREGRALDIEYTTTTALTRNKRSVWNIATKPYSEAHFATFPEEIPTVCIKAGTSEKGCCPECGSPWERVVDISYQQHRKPGEWCERGKDERGLNRSESQYKYGSATKIGTTTGWQPTCSHDLKPIPCTVLDPFAGAGTVGVVCQKLNRKSIGIELNPAYVKMAERRIYEINPLFNQAGGT